MLFLLRGHAICHLGDIFGNRSIVIVSDELRGTYNNRQLSVSDGSRDE